MVWGAIAAAGISAAANLIGGKKQQDASQDMAREQMDFQRAENTRAMDFSERMSNSQWQRGVADMKAAGLNPILAVSQGGASSPSGVTSSGARGEAVNAIGRAGSAGVASALAATRLDAEVDQLRAQTKQTEQLTKQSEATTLKELETAANVATDTGLKNEIIANTRETRQKIIEDTGLSREGQKLSGEHQEESRKRQDSLKAQTDILTTNLQSAKAAAARDKETEEFYQTPIGRLIYLLGLSGKTLNPFNEAISSGKAAVNIGGK